MAKIYPFPLTRGRQPSRVEDAPGHRSIVFHCDFCDASLDTGRSMWRYALEEMQREGWRRFKEGTVWHTTCGTHMRDYNKRLIDLELNLHYETHPGEENAGAIRVSNDGDPSNGVWLPKSQIEFVDKGQSIVDVTMPEWLALEKGLI